MGSLRYVRVDEPYWISLAEEPIPEPGPDEVRLRAVRSLISAGSELRRYRRYEGYGAFQYPVTDLGYSMVGAVEAVGANVTAAKPGERFIAVKRHATHVLTQVEADTTRTAVRVPDGVSDEEGTFGPLLRSTLNWTRNFAVEAEDTVVVVGQGLVGALQLQGVRLHSPRRVFVTDGNPLRLDLARRMGADEAIDVNAGDPVAAIRELTGGRGADVVIETVGGAYVDSVGQSIQMCRSGGRVVIVGMHTAPIPIPYSGLHSLTIVGSNVGYDYSARLFRRAMELLAEGRFQVAPLITHRFSYEEAAAAFDLLDRRPGEAMGVVLEW